MSVRAVNSYEYVCDLCGLKAYANKPAGTEATTPDDWSWVSINTIFAKKCVHVCCHCAEDINYEFNKISSINDQKTIPSDGPGV